MLGEETRQNKMAGRKKKKDDVMIEVTTVRMAGPENSVRVSSAKTGENGVSRMEVRTKKKKREMRLSSNTTMP